MTYPPGPRDWTGGFRLFPIIKRNLLGFYADMHRQYGDVVYMRLGPYRDYTFFHPDAIKEILVTKAKQFIKMPRQKWVLAQWNGNGLLLSEGDFWLRQRRLVQPAFHHKRFAGYGQVMVEETKKLAARWQALVASSCLVGEGYTSRAAPPPQPSPSRGEGANPEGEGAAVDVIPTMVDLTLAIIGRVFFGVALTARSRELGQTVDVLSRASLIEFQQPFSLPRWWPSEWNRQKQAAIRDLDDFIRGVIKERRAAGNPDRGDLLSMLLLAVDDEGDGGQMTDEQARDEAVVLFLAGHDTTASGLTWIWYVLAQHPEVAAKLRAELDRELGDRDVTVADLPRLTYLERVIQETLRLYPPAVGVFTRMPAQDTDIAGVPLKKGSLVRILSFITQRDERWWPEPERFDPDRFLPEQVAERPQYSYLPFGGGPRVCIGRDFASAEMALIVATLARQFELTLPPDSPPKELELKLSLWPKDGLKLDIKHREVA